MTVGFESLELVSKQNFKTLMFKGNSKKGAVKSDYHKIIRDDDGNEVSREPIYAVPLEVSGYSLTNLAYGADGYRYLMYDGRFYRSKEKFKKFVEEAKAKEAQVA